MKLYHFTSRHHVNGCLKKGLKYGLIPLSIDPPKLIRGFQWLTKRKSFEQSWSKYSSLPYDRTDYRITVKIPKAERNNLFDWLLFCKQTNIQSANDLNCYGDPENWMLFKGIVLPKWFRDIDKNPGI